MYTNEKRINNINSSSSNNKQTNALCVMYGSAELARLPSGGRQRHEHALHHLFIVGRWSIASACVMRGRTTRTSDMLADAPLGTAYTCSIIISGELIVDDVFALRTIALRRRLKRHRLNNNNNKKKDTHTHTHTQTLRQQITNGPKRRLDRQRRARQIHESMTYTSSAHKSSSSTTDTHDVDLIYAFGPYQHRRRRRDI
jgi:hypothetical protein